MDEEMTRSGGNVFEDLGYEREEAEHLKARADLMIQLREFIRESGNTQKAVAARFGVTQPRISDLMRGKINLFSIDGLVEVAGQAGLHVRIELEREAA